MRTIGGDQLDMHLHGVNLAQWTACHCEAEGSSNPLKIRR
jgi:hypothetical protein